MPGREVSLRSVRSTNDDSAKTASPVRAGPAVLMAWRFTRNLRAIGGGLGVVVQGLGLLVLDLTFASILARLV